MTEGECVFLLGNLLPSLAPDRTWTDESLASQQVQTIDLVETWQKLKESGVKLSPLVPFLFFCFVSSFANELFLSSARLLAKIVQRWEEGSSDTIAKEKKGTR